MFVRGTDDAPKQTGFKKKKSDKKGTDGLTEQNRLMKMWERFGKVIRPEIKPIERTTEEYKEANEMNKMYNRQCLALHKADQGGKSHRLRLARAAFTQLPAELQAHAMKDDLAPLPADFPKPLPHPPLPGQDIYGEFQLPKHMKRKVQTGLDFE
jgi:hypothetical protein